MKREDIEAIKARCEAATEGPWILWDGWERGSGISCVASLGREGDWQDRLTPTYDGKEIQGPTADFEFIAHARQDIPSLIKRVEELQREVLKMTAERDDALRVKNEVLQTMTRSI